MVTVGHKLQKLQQSKSFISHIRFDKKQAQPKKVIENWLRAYVPPGKGVKGMGK